VTQLKQKAGQANASEKNVIAEKLRRLTPGGPTIIAALGLDDR